MNAKRSPHLFKASLLYTLDGEQDDVRFSGSLSGRPYRSLKSLPDANSFRSVVSAQPKGAPLSGRAQTFGAQLLLPQLRGHFSEFVPRWGERILGGSGINDGINRRMILGFRALISAGSARPCALVCAGFEIELSAGTLFWVGRGRALEAFGLVMTTNAYRYEAGLRDEFREAFNAFFDETEINLISLDQF